jgi:hypothetical protein
VGKKSKSQVSASGTDALCCGIKSQFEKKGRTEQRRKRDLGLFYAKHLFLMECGQPCYPFSTASRPDGTGGNRPRQHFLSFALETMAVA